MRTFGDLYMWARAELDFRDVRIVVVDVGVESRPGG